MTDSLRQDPIDLERRYIREGVLRIAQRERIVIDLESRGRLALLAGARTVV